MLCSGKVSTLSRFVVDDGSSCKSSIPLVARYPAGKENGVVLCILKDVPDNILNVGQLGCIVREHLGSTSWTNSIFHLVLFDSFESCNAHCVQEHKCVPTHAMALEMIWSECTLSLRILSLIFLCQWIPVTKRMKLTNNNHVELLTSQLSTFITSLLEHQCCELSGAWYVCHPAACTSTRLLGTVQFSSALHRWSHRVQQ